MKTESPDVAQEVYLAALPLFHVFALLTTQMYGLYMGHKIVYMPRFAIDPYLKAITVYKVRDWDVIQQNICVAGGVVSVLDFHAVDPGSIPGLNT